MNFISNLMVHVDIRCTLAMNFIRITHNFTYLLMEQKTEELAKNISMVIVKELLALLATFICERSLLMRHYH